MGKAWSEGRLASKSLFRGLTRIESADKYVDDKTWADLEFPKIFSYLDSTQTPLGGQSLFRKLREYIDNRSELTERYEAYDALRSNAPLREEIQLKLASLRADSNAGIADAVFGQPLEKPKYHGLFPILSLLSVATLTAVLTLSLPLGFWFAIVAFNTVVVFRVSPYLHRDAETLEFCYALLRVADGLASIQPNSASLPQFKRLARGVAACNGEESAWIVLLFAGGSRSEPVLVAQPGILVGTDCLRSHD